MAQVPEGVIHALGVFFAQKRRIWSGISAQKHVDGYAAISIMARIKGERGGDPLRKQRWPEVYTGEALDVWRALQGMPEKPYICLHLHYLGKGAWYAPIKVKARHAEVSVAQYWVELRCAETWVAARLSAMPVTENV